MRRQIKNSLGSVGKDEKTLEELTETITEWDNTEKRLSDEEYESLFLRGE